MDIEYQVKEIAEELNGRILILIFLMILMVIMIYLKNLCLKLEAMLTPIFHMTVCHIMNLLKNMLLLMVVKLLMMI